MTDSGRDDAFVVHIAPRAAWDRVRAVAGPEYTDPSLQAEGFIHCSTLEQVLIPANERFGGRDDLVLLVIDLRDVASRVVFEDCYDSGLAFPHIYGPIPTSAVKQVTPFPCSADGTFELPTELSDLA